MDRKIKFRIWDKGKGGFLKSFDDSYTRLEYLLNTKGEIFEWIESSEAGGDFVEKIKEDLIISQYTGLKDQNGKEIYEGDLVRIKIQIGYEENYTQHEFISRVEYYISSYVFLPLRIILDSGDILKSEVIGNIYENPELLGL